MTRFAPRSARRARNLGSVLVAAALSMGLAAPALAQTTPSVSASFNAGVLTVTGDGADNTISISRGGNGVILVNGGAVSIAGGSPSIRNTTLIQISAQGGADQISLEEASGLPNAEVSGGDGVDSIVVNGANLNEVFAMAPNNGRVRLERTDPAPFSIDLDGVEEVTLNMNAGDDTFNGSNGVAALIQKITIDAGPGFDTIFGTDVAETFIGGEGNDTIDGNRGNDIGLMGPGDDTFIWDPGDGNDTEEGQEGHDRLVFNGAGGADTADVSANGSRVRFFRQPGNVTMDLDDVEQIDFNALAGADTMVVNDLSGTDMQDVNLELASTLGGFAGDGAADAITVNGTNGDDAIVVARTNGNVVVSGLASRVSIGAAEGALDTLTINGLEGNDTLDASGLPAGRIGLTFVP